VSTIRKPAIGKVDTQDREIRRAIYAIKERLEMIAGERGDTVIAKLAPEATLTDVINKFNELIELLQ
jgi:MinD-like ATPase involved in chromosome partitioning or flagellar assembly